MEFPTPQNMPPKLFLQFISISGFRHLLPTVILRQISFLFVSCIVSIKKFSYLQDKVESSELSEQNDHFHSDVMQCILKSSLQSISVIR